MVEFKFKSERERCKRKIEKECERERDKKLYRFAHTNRHSQELPEMTEISTFFYPQFWEKVTKMYNSTSGSIFDYSAFIVS